MNVVSRMAAVDMRVVLDVLVHGAFMSGDAIRLATLGTVNTTARDGVRRLAESRPDARVFGNMAIVKLARSCSKHVAKLTCWNAAKAGDLPALKALRATGCPWDKRTCAAAAAGGHLEMLQWARSHGCSWNSDTCFQAAYYERLHVLQWLRDLAHKVYPEVLEWVDGNSGLNWIVSNHVPPCSSAQWMSSQGSGHVGHLG